jgi:hypothetical protein
MPKFLAVWFAYCLITSLFVAYLTEGRFSLLFTIRQFFRVAETATFLAYGLGNLSNGIWKKQTWSANTTDVVDGLI